MTSEESRPLRMRPGDDAAPLDFPVYCSRLRDCFTFDLAKPAGRGELISRWFLHPPYRAVASFRLAQWFYRRRLIKTARWILVRSRIRTGAEIHVTARIGPRLKLPHPNGVVIGAGVVIGPDVRILQQVTVGGPGREVDTGSQRRYPVVEAGANIYAGARVIGPMTIGAGASIGANAVVVGDVPPGALAVGVPAKVIPPEQRKHSRSRVAHLAPGDDEDED